MLTYMYRNIIKSVVILWSNTQYTTCPGNSIAKRSGSGPSRVYCSDLWMVNYDHRQGHDTVDPVLGRKASMSNLYLSNDTNVPNAKVDGHLTIEGVR